MALIPTRYGPLRTTGQDGDLVEGVLGRCGEWAWLHEQSEDATFAIGPYSFQPANKLLIDAKGKRLRLTDKEASILKYLYRAGEKAVAREVLLAEVWGYNAGVTTHTLETHVYRLRQKIESDPAHAKLLITEGGGYRLQP